VCASVCACTSVRASTADRGHVVGGPRRRPPRRGTTQCLRPGPRTPPFRERRRQSGGAGATCGSARPATPRGRDPVPARAWRGREWCWGRRAGATVEDGRDYSNAQMGGKGERAAAKERECNTLVRSGAGHRERGRASCAYPTPVSRSFTAFGVILHQPPSTPAPGCRPACASRARSAHPTSASARCSPRIQPCQQANRAFARPPCAQVDCTARDRGT
jgi:hypothetical protein